ncbi:MAG: hypothetical protein JO363_15645, partial [Solirubrobacterales bacterium]|nr:hypothetical protein [Solirubrobacterales bacterium]
MLAAIIAAPPDRVSGLSLILGVAAIVAGLMVVGKPDGLSISASFITFTLAAVFLGARSAAVAAVLSEITASLRLRTRLRSVILVNLPAAVIPAIASALTAYAITTHRGDSSSFYLAVSAAAIVGNTLSFVIFALLRRAFFPSWSQFGLQAFVAALPSIALNVLLVVAGAGITVRLGTAGIAFALSAVFTFSYMAHLLEQSRQRAEQYMSLSWGVLAGLLRALDTRDQRAARHAAAVARFASDMAESVGMSEQDQELAHTSGLLHD